MSDSLKSRVEIFEEDVDLTHQLVHSDDNTSVLTENGEIPSFAKLQRGLKEDVLNRSEYEFLGDYASDIQVDYYYQLLRENGEFWRPSADTILPYTTTGAGMPEDGAFVPVGDAALRSSLEDQTNETLGASLVGHAGGTVAGDLREMRPDQTLTDVFIVYGQSNAKGSAAATPGRLEITGKAEYWSLNAQAITPLDHEIESTSTYGVEAAHVSSGHAWGAFANRYAELTGRKLVIIPGAIGGTSIAELSKGSATGIYSSLSTEVPKALNAVSARGDTLGSIVVLFHQGESDQSDGTTHVDYRAALDTLFSDMKTDFGVDRFLLALVGSPQSRTEESWHIIRSAQESLCDEREDTSVAFSGFRYFTQTNELLRSDGVHATQRGYNIMGRAMADHVINMDRLESAAGDEAAIEGRGLLQVESNNRNYLAQAVIKLESSGATLQTRDNNSLFLSSFIDNVAIGESSQNLSVRLTGLRLGQIFAPSVTAVVASEDGNGVEAEINIVEVPDGVTAAIKLFQDAVIDVDTNNGTLLSRRGVGDLGPLNDAVSITDTGSSYEIYSTVQMIMTPICARYTGSADPDGAVGDAVIPRIVSEKAFRIPKNIGRVSCYLPKVQIPPGDIPSGLTILVYFSAVVSSSIV